MQLCWHADKKDLNIYNSGIAHFSSYLHLGESQAFVQI